MKSMSVEVAFFDADELLCRGTINLTTVESESEFVAERGERFELAYQFEQPASRVFIRCHKDGSLVFRSALRMGVHDSDDWESTDLAEPYQLCFRCTVHDEA